MAIHSLLSRLVERAKLAGDLDLEKQQDKTYPLMLKSFGEFIQTHKFDKALSHLADQMFKIREMMGKPISRERALELAYLAIEGKELDPEIKAAWNYGQDLKPRVKSEPKPALTPLEITTLRLVAMAYRKLYHNPETASQMPQSDDQTYNNILKMFEELISEHIKKSGYKP